MLSNMTKTFLTGETKKVGADGFGLHCLSMDILKFERFLTGAPSDVSCFY